MSHSKPVLSATIRTSGDEVFGQIAHSADTPAVLEALALIIQQVSKSCEVPPAEICDDLKKLF